MSGGHRIVISGGGTGGHIYPALAVADQLKQDDRVEAILYIGATGHLEERLAEQRQVDFTGLEFSGMPRKISGKLVAWPFLFAGAIAKAKAVLRRFQPTGVLGTGGYAAAPPLAAAYLSGIPYAVHEPDAHPGLVNKAFAPGARLVSLGMEGARSVLKPQSGQVAFNGNPIGNGFINPLPRVSAAAILGVRPDYPTLLITGGSQGAQAINDAVLEALPTLLQLDPPIQILHQLGEKNFEEFRQRIDLSVVQTGRYHPRPYFDDLSLAYAVSDLTICRAGAMTDSELAAMGVPAIFIPYPFAAADHQTHNARYFESKGGAVVIPQAELNARDLANLVQALLTDSPRLRGMSKAMRDLGKPDAAKQLAMGVIQMSQDYMLKKATRVG